MSFVNSLLSLPREGLIVAGFVVFILLVIWLRTLFSRWRYVVIKRSDETEMLAFHIRRMADALERLATARETQPPAGASVEKRVGMSTFGR